MHAEFEMRTLIWCVVMVLLSWVVSITPVNSPGADLVAVLVVGWVFWGMSLAVRGLVRWLRT